VDIANSTMRSLFSEHPFVIDESCVINLNTDYVIEYVKHQLNDALAIKRELDLNPLAGYVLELPLTTSIDTTPIPNLGVVGETILHSGKSVESRVKRGVTRTLASRSERPPTYGWRVDDREFNKLHNLDKFIVEGCCDSLGLNGHTNLFFYSEHNSFLYHDVSSGHSIYCNPPW